MDKLSYADDFAQAIKDVLEGQELKVSHREAQTIVQEYFAKQNEKIQAERAEQGKVHKEAGEKYLAENAKKDGGLQLMQEGAKYRFFIPYRLGYGAGGAGAQIPPFAALIFDVELIQVV